MPTANMNLTLPTDHGSADVWDTILDAAFTAIDAHDHTTGKGVKVPSAALNINADISWSSGGVYYAVKDAKAIDFQPTTQASITAYSSVFYVSSGDSELHFKDASARDIQITNAGSLNVSLVGGIGGDYSSVGALFSFDDATDRYLAQQQGSPRPWAGMALGNLDIYQQAASITNRVRQKSPAALAASYDMTWFAALPGSPATILIAQIDGNGQWTASNTISNAVSFSSTVGTTGLITATGGITLPGAAVATLGTHVAAYTATGLFTASGGITVGAAAFDFSAATSVVAPSRTMMIPASAAQAAGGTTAYSDSGTLAKWALSSSGAVINVPITLATNDRISSLTVYFARNSGTNVILALKKADATGTWTTLCSKTIAAGSGDTTTDIGSSPTSGSLPQTLDSTSSYVLVMTTATAGTADNFYGCKVAFDRTA